MRRECRERLPRHRLQKKPTISDPGMRHARALMHVGIANTRWRGERSRRSRRMHDPQLYVSGKRPVGVIDKYPLHAGGALYSKVCKY